MERQDQQRADILAEMADLETQLAQTQVRSRGDMGEI